MTQKRICYSPDKPTCGTCRRQGKGICVGRQNEERFCPAYESKRLCDTCKHRIKGNFYNPSCHITIGERTIELNSISYCPCCDYYEEEEIPF